MSVPLYVLPGEALPRARQVVAACEVQEVAELPLLTKQPALAYGPDGLELLLGDGTPPYRPPNPRAGRADRRGLLSRAVGADRGDRPLVLDAMSGWGTDARTLLSLGCGVTSVERVELVWAFLAEAASDYPGWDVRCEDAWQVIAEREWPVVYLDPMFPPRGQKGLAKKPMQILRRLAADDDRSLAAWVEHAVAHTTGRVVVKQRRKSPAPQPADWQLVGRSVRYDVYRGRR